MIRYLLGAALLCGLASGVMAAEYGLGVYWPGVKWQDVAHWGDRLGDVADAVFNTVIAADDYQWSASRCDSLIEVAAAEGLDVHLNNWDTPFAWRSKTRFWATLLEAEDDSVATYDTGEIDGDAWHCTGSDDGGTLSLRAKLKYVPADPYGGGWGEGWHGQFAYRMKVNALSGFDICSLRVVDAAADTAPAYVPASELARVPQKVTGVEY